jgi:hypothetical protein
MFLQKGIKKKVDEKIIFIGVLKVTGAKSRIRSLSRIRIR